MNYRHPHSHFSTPCSLARSIYHLPFSSILVHTLSHLASTFNHLFFFWLSICLRTQHSPNLSLYSIHQATIRSPPTILLTTLPLAISSNAHQSSMSSHSPSAAQLNQLIRLQPTQHPNQTRSLVNVYITQLYILSHLFVLYPPPQPPVHSWTL